MSQDICGCTCIVQSTYQVCLLYELSRTTRVLLFGNSHNFGQINSQTKFLKYRHNAGWFDHHHGNYGKLIITAVPPSE